MPKWAWWTIIILILLLFVIPNPTRSGTAVGDAFSAVAQFFRSIAASVGG